MKQNWRKKYEETAGLLKLCRDGNELLNVRVVAAKQELANRPTVEKIVEKEVLPSYVAIILTGIMFLGGVFVVEEFLQLRKLQQPILSPYPVYITKLAPFDPYKLSVCQDSWREDEAKLKVLRRKLKDRQEGTVYVP